MIQIYILKLFSFIQKDKMKNLYSSSGFFAQVKDTVQVDQNVSRHLSVELNMNDWNLMV